MAKEKTIEEEVQAMGDSLRNELLEMLNESEPYRKNKDNSTTLEPKDEQHAKLKEYGSAFGDIPPQPFFFNTINKWLAKHRIKGTIEP